MHPSIEPGCKAIPQHGLEKPVAEIVRGESVAVVQEHTTPLDRGFERVLIRLNPELRRKVIHHPAVVIAGEIFHGDAAIGEGLQGGKGSVKSFWYDCPVFEPEVKQISHDIQLIGGWENVLEQGEKAVFLVAFLIPRTEAKMDVGDKVNGHCEIYENQRRK